MSSIPYIAVYVYFCQMAQFKPIEILVPQFTSMAFDQASDYAAIPGNTQF